MYPLGAGSPFFSSLPLSEYGLQWIHSPAPVAHPLDDGMSVVLERDLAEAKLSLGEDGKAWGDLVQPFVELWPDFASDVLRPISRIPKHPLLMARFGMNALRSARTVVSRFRSERTRALFAGLAAHSCLGSGRSSERSIRHAHGNTGTCGRLANSARRSAITYQRPLRLSGESSAARSALHRDLKISNSSPTTICKCSMSPRGSCWRWQGRRLSERYKRQLQELSLWPRGFQSGLCLEQPDPLAGR